jgi:hypothetical protein
MNFKNINIGSFIRTRVEECGLDPSKLRELLGISGEEIEKVYETGIMSMESLMQWSELLEYDFFRIYTEHLILHAPQSNVNYAVVKKKKVKRPVLRKNIYTKEIIDFIIELIETGRKTEMEIVEDYEIPKSTLYKWIFKFKKQSKPGLQNTEE